MTSAPVAASFLFSAVCIAVYPFLRIWFSKKRSYPPGPAGLPVLGNIFNNPSTVNEPYKEWPMIYGPIAYFGLITHNIYVINSREVAYELLDKRASNYSDRPRQVMCGELMSWNRGIALCPGGSQHRAYRRLVNRTLSASATQKLWPVQVQAARSLVKDLLRYVVPQSQTQPDNENLSYNVIDMLRQSIGINVVEIIFGRSQSFSDEPNKVVFGMSKQDTEEYIKAADYAHSLFGKALVPFAYMVDWLPWLTFLPESFPLVQFKKDARIAKRGLEDLTMKPYLKARERIKHGLAQVSYLDTCFASSKDPTSSEENSFAWTAMSAYTGGSDTTISAVTTIILAAATNRKALSLVQEELDGIIGQDRFPELGDRVNLPYLSAFIQECMRSRPVVPLGVPHRATEEDEIDGYHIPSGATIIPNIRGMLNDSRVYKTPTKFEPERFLPPTGTPTNPNIEGRLEPDIGHLHFGFGRRLCPGLHLATSGVWVYAASLLWAFDINPSKEPGATSLSWETAEFSDGAITYPKPFKVEFSARSERIASVVSNSA